MIFILFYFILFYFLDVNQNYQFCATYPSVLVVPKDVTDEELFAAAQFRSKARIPILSNFFEFIFSTIFFFHHFCQHFFFSTFYFFFNILVLF